jgi:putative ABC transport system permease protein
LPKIRNLDGVSAATGVYLAGNLISYKDESGSWQIYAVNPDSFQKVFKNKLSEGSFLSEDSTDGIVLGAQIAGNGLSNKSNYASTLKTVPVGDSVTATLGLGTQRSLTVKGIINNEFQLADLRAFINYKTLNKLLPGVDTKATSIYIKTAPGVSSSKVIDEINKLDSDLKLLTPDSIPGSIQEQTNTINVINQILSSISLFVAAITVFIVTYVDLVNRRRVIGIERAIGISPSAIVLNYCIRAFLYAVLGILLGAVLYKFALIPYFQQHPFIFPVGPVSLVDQPDFIVRYTCILLIVALVAAWLPSWRSVKIKILDAIWK